MADEMSEQCSNCNQSQPHTVSIQLLEESQAAENSEFSREPYRVTECRVCGVTTRTRMNNV